MTLQSVAVTVTGRWRLIDGVGHSRKSTSLTALAIQSDLEEKEAKQKDNDEDDEVEEEKEEEMREKWRIIRKRK